MVFSQIADCTALHERLHTALKQADAASPAGSASGWPSACLSALESEPCTDLEAGVVSAIGDNGSPSFGASGLGALSFGGQA